MSKNDQSEALSSFGSLNGGNLTPIWNYLNGASKRGSPGDFPVAGTMKFENLETMIPLLTSDAIDHEVCHVRKMLRDSSFTPVGKFMSWDCQVIVYASRRYKFVVEYEGDDDESNDGFYQVGDTREQVSAALTTRGILFQCPKIPVPLDFSKLQENAIRQLEAKLGPLSDRIEKLLGENCSTSDNIRQQVEKIKAEFLQLRDEIRILQTATSTRGEPLPLPFGGS